MHSPYEELEYLAEHLPEEGETLLVRRESGELICKAYQRNDLRSGVDDAELYGMLVQANERLHAVAAFPPWVAVIALAWLGISLHVTGILALSQWYVIPGLALPLCFAVFQWIQLRQHRLFVRCLRPRLASELRRRGISRLALIAGVRQHPELRTLLDELVGWEAAGELPLT